MKSKQFEGFTLYRHPLRASVITRLYNRLRFGIEDPFNNVEIETSSFCNRKCSYCPNIVMNRGKHFMAPDLFKRFILDLKKMRFSGVIKMHFYNEPLLDPRLPQFISFVKRNLPRAKIDLYTNGDVLTVKLLEKLRTCRVDTVIISSHDAVMKPHIEKITADPHYRKFVYHQFVRPENPLFNRGGTVKIKNQIKLDSCFLPATTVTVNYQGKVILCCNDPHASIVFGDLHQESIISIWQKPEYKQLRARISQGQFELAICQKCRD